MADGDSAADGWQQGRGGFRVDSRVSSQDNVTLQGDFYTGHEATPVGARPIPAARIYLGRWTRSLADGSDFTLQTYVDRTHISNPEGPLSIASLQISPPGTLSDDLTTLDLDFQNRIYLTGREQIVWGLGYRHTHDTVGNAPRWGSFRHR